MVFLANSLFTFRCCWLMPGLGDQRVALPASALEQISFWSFVDAFTEDIPFLMHQHVSLALYTDASGYGWGAHVLLPNGPLQLGDYWTSQLFAHDIRSKEGLAVLFALRSLEASLYRRRINVFVDNHGLVYAWDGLEVSFLWVRGGAGEHISLLLGQ